MNNANPIRSAVCRIAASLVLCALVTQAHAQSGERLYLGIGAGMVDSQSGLDLDAAGPALRLGYEFSQRLSAELGYLALRDQEEDDAWSASVVVTFPLTALDLYGRLGAMHHDGRQSVTLGSGLDSASDTSTRGFAALGAQMRFKRFDLYGEFSRVDSDSAEDVDIISAGFKFRF